MRQQPLPQCGLHLERGYDRYTASGRGNKKTMMSALQCSTCRSVFCSCVSFADFSDFIYEVEHPSEADDQKRVLSFTVAFRSTISPVCSDPEEQTLLTPSSYFPIFLQKSLRSESDALCSLSRREKLESSWCSTTLKRVTPSSMVVLLHHRCVDKVGIRPISPGPHGAIFPNRRLATRLGRETQFHTALTVLEVTCSHKNSDVGETECVHIQGGASHMPRSKTAPYVEPKMSFLVAKLPSVNAGMREVLRRVAQWRILPDGTQFNKTKHMLCPSSSCVVGKIGTFPIAEGTSLQCLQDADAP